MMTILDLIRFLLSFQFLDPKAGEIGHNFLLRLLIFISSNGFLTLCSEDVYRVEEGDN